MPIKLTEREIARMACPADKPHCLVFDTEQRGLAVRVMAAGSKTYLAQYSGPAGKRRVALGSVDAISLAAARVAARTVMGQVASGSDPAGKRKAAALTAKIEGQRELMTLERLVNDWTRIHLATRKPRYQAEAVGTIRRVFADWLPRPADRLTRRDVVQLLDQLPPNMARATAAYGRACFGWGARRDSVAGNPFVSLPVQGVTKRDRVLDEAELARVWTAAAAASAPFGPLVCIMILTGQRREEVAGMAWAEMSADLETWTIPAERTKNGVPSVVPLSASAVAIVHQRLITMRGQRRGLVFPGASGLATFGGWSKSKTKLDADSVVTDWRLHDLRRTVATGLQRLGVRLEVTEAVLNHVSGTRGGIVGIYQRHDWAAEKRAALEGWAAHLDAVVAGVEVGPKVVPMRRSKPNAA